MFDKTERQFFAGQDVYGVIQTMQQVLYANGIALQQNGPNTWAGRGTTPSYGLVPRVSLFAQPTPQGFSLDVRITADTEGSGIAIAIVLWFFFFPAAIILGYMAWQDFQQRQALLMQSMWGPVSHLFVAPNFGPVFGSQPGAPPPH